MGLRIHFRYVLLVAVAVAATGCYRPPANSIGTLSRLPSLPLPADAGDRVPADLAALADLADRTQERLADARQWLTALEARVAEQDRRHYRPDEEERLAAMMGEILADRAALLALVERYGGHQQAAGERTRTAAAVAHAMAALVSYALDLDVLTLPGGAMLRRKVNEGDEEAGVVRGAFDMVGQSAGDSANETLCQRLTRTLPAEVSACRRADGADPAVLDRLAAHGRQAGEVIVARAADGRRAWEAIRRDGRAEQAQTVAYAFQKCVSLSVAAVRLNRKPCIRPSQRDQAVLALRPGDILLRQRFGNLTNAFIPGFYTHAMLYVGSAADLAELGVAESPGKIGTVTDFVETRGAFAGPWPKSVTVPIFPHGQGRRVLEVGKTGVVLSSLEHAFDGDSVLVLRPRLEREQIAKALTRALRCFGRPYDFDYDLCTANSLTCAELIWRAYADLLDLQAARMHGRDMLTADGIARQFQRERTRQDRRLEFVLLLTGKDPNGEARFAGVEEVPSP